MKFLGFESRRKDSAVAKRGGVFDRYGVVLLFLYAAAVLLFLGIGAYEQRRIAEDIDAVALERGRVLFGLIELTRDWNARHGGVYVPVSAQTQPNPYLEHPLRDLQTHDGPALTMVNPAFMTRQIAELAEEATGIRFHITSLKPIRPANAADAWEAESLRFFERVGRAERIAFVEDFPLGGGAQPVHRYMAPLLVKTSCLQCHEKQGYRVGDIRGGISVTMPAADLLAVRDQRFKGAMLIVTVGFVVAGVLLHLLVWRARRHYLKLQEIARSQEDIIAARTSELEVRNRELSGEVEERRRREQELRLAGAVFESAAEGIMVTDADNNIVRVNPAFTEITGYAQEEVRGRNPRLLKSGRHDAAFYAEMWSAVGTHGRWEGEIWNRHKDGNVYVEWLSIVKIDDGQGAEQYLAVFHDITHRKRAEEELHYKAHHDALTDLPNRSLFYDRLQAIFNQAKRYRRAFALLMVDLDRFKEVNDSYGHAAGDQLLVEAARRLASCVRESDTVARLGGDEFAIIVTDVEHEQEVEQIAQRAVELLAEPYHLDAGTARISGCIGIAFYPQHGHDPEALQRNADAALYAAKESGRNCYRVHVPLRRGDDPQGDLL